MAGVSEALALGASLGLDPKQLSAVMNGSSARCWSLECYSPVPVGSGSLPLLVCCPLDAGVGAWGGR
jgi:3-hydroxyisobutyrate dehydrogenase-like beta-hydroxyacid dehydrogenase